MLYKPDLIVYVWMIPAIMFFVIPVLLLPLALMTKKAAAGKMQYAEQNESFDTGFATMDKRTFPRQKYAGLYAHVSDGVNCCKASINNVSKQGINFALPTDTLSKDADHLGVLLTGSGMSFPLEVKPTWKDLHGKTQNIGATIVSAPPQQWEEFTSNIDDAS